MRAELTKELLEQARDNMIRCVIAKDDDARRRVREPDFIRAMTHRELCEWDVELYKLALRALEQTADAKLGAAVRGQLLDRGVVHRETAHEIDLFADALLRRINAGVSPFEEPERSPIVDVLRAIANALREEEAAHA